MMGREVNLDASNIFIFYSKLPSSVGLLRLEFCNMPMSPSIGIYKGLK